MEQDCQEAGCVEDVEKEFVNSCPHYSRGCSFVSPCCGKVYDCRLCHDDEELSHSFDRYAVKEIVCSKCSTKQPVSNLCSECDLTFGKYYCEVCHLYDNKDKGQFHCDKCGLCRVGGQEKYFHCDKCGFCLDKSMLDTHLCRQDSSNNNCPVCMEDIHTSRDPAHVPKCGHLLHTSCYKEFLRKGLYQCPQCQTSLCDMKSSWEATDLQVNSWEMPQHLKNFKVKILCRDCHTESDTIFHIIGLKCMGADCGSYNTVRCGQEEIPEDAVPVRAQEFMEFVRQRREARDNHQDDNGEDSDQEDEGAGVGDDGGNGGDAQEDGDGEGVGDI